MSVRFKCYYPLEEGYFFIVELQLNYTVYDLRKKVRETLLSECELCVSWKDLRLFKACFSLSGA